MKRFVTFAILAIAMCFAAISISVAFTQGITVPPGATKVEQQTIATNINGTSTVTTSTVNVVAGSVYNVTIPNATPTTQYGADVYFLDAQGHTITESMVVEPLYSDGTDCGTWVCPQ